MRRVAAAMTLLFALLSLPGCGGAPEIQGGNERKPVTVEVRTATPRTIPVNVEATGNVEPWVRVSPGAKILGRIARVSFREGDRVGAGRVMVQLENLDLQAAADQARAAVSMAEASLENSRTHHERMVTLRERGSVTDKNVEDATAAFRVATAQLEQARANLVAAEVTVGYAEIRTPISGVVVDKRAEAGDMVTPGTPLFTVEDLSHVKVVVQVPESGVVGLEEGDGAKVRIDVLADTRDAIIDRVLPAADTLSRTYRVQLELDNPDGRIKSGMFARAWFERGTREALLVPATAVVDRGQLRGVYIVDDGGVARLRWVRTGRELDGGVEVISGLDRGERFVVSPAPILTDGAAVVAR